MINWEKLYNNLLIKKISINGEKHHIVPKHDGGKNKDGIVILERRYHILAHYIRWRWKKQVGDKCAYKIMHGQIKNPMHDEEIRSYTMEIINNMVKDENYIIKKSQQIKDRWNNKESREVILNGRRDWINSEDNRIKLTNRLNTVTAKEKRSIKIKAYYAKVDRSTLKTNNRKVLVLENNIVLDSVKSASIYFDVSKKTICRWAKNNNKVQYIK
jgi:hypothetical protein